MPRYIRSKRFGGTFFFTVTLRDRHSSVLVDHVDLLRECVRHVKSKRPFDIIAGWFCQIIFMQFGGCRREIMLFPYGGS